MLQKDKITSKKVTQLSTKEIIKSHEHFPMGTTGMERAPKPVQICEMTLGEFTSPGKIAIAVASLSDNEKWKHDISWLCHILMFLPYRLSSKESLYSFKALRLDSTI